MFTLKTPLTLSILFAMAVGCAASGVQELPSGVVQVDLSEADFVADEPLTIELNEPGIVHRVDAPTDLVDELLMLHHADGTTSTAADLVGSSSAERRQLLIASTGADMAAARAAGTTTTTTVATGTTATAFRAQTGAGAGGGTGCLGGGSLGYSCSLFACSCDGDTDCNDMFCSDVCGGDAVCDETDGTTCWCWRGSRTISRVRRASRSTR